MLVRQCYFLMNVTDLLTMAAFCNKIKTLIVDNEQNKFIHKDSNILNNSKQLFESTNIISFHVMDSLC